MKYETHLGLMKIREVLKRYSVIVYTGHLLDEIVMMDMELTDLFEGRMIEEELVISISSGSGVQDVAAAWVACQEASRTGIGVRFDLSAAAMEQ